MKNKLIKFGLLGFAILSLGIASFSSAGSITVTGSIIQDYIYNNDTYSFYLGIPFSRYDLDTTVYYDCTFDNPTSLGLVGRTVRAMFGNNFSYGFSSSSDSTFISSSFHFDDLTNISWQPAPYFTIKLAVGNVSDAILPLVFNFSCTFSGEDIVDGNSGPCPEQYTSLECQTEYNLLTQNSCDIQYSGYVSPSVYNSCTSSLNNSSNALSVCQASLSSCLSANCPSSDGISNLYINDIFHVGAPNIIMNIPEEIDWDYAYTNSGSNFNLDVVGYNQDTEYIDSLIDVQNYKPSSEDFTKVFSNFSNFGGLLIACLFVILVFYFVKKIFK